MTEVEQVVAVAEVEKAAPDPLDAFRDISSGERFRPGDPRRQLFRSW
jgi:hypothetical protein